MKNRPRTIGETIFCTKGQHYVARHKFKTRSDRAKPHSWCIDCKREYDRMKIATKRRQKRGRANDRRNHPAAPQFGRSRR